MNPGDVYEISWDGGKPRFVVVVSREQLNRGDYAVVVPVTSKKYELRCTLPNCVPFEAGEFGFTEDCVAQAEQLSTIEQHHLGSDPAFSISEEALAKIGQAIGNVIACQYCQYADEATSFE